VSVVQAAGIAQQPSVETIDHQPVLRGDDETISVDHSSAALREIMTT